MNYSVTIQSVAWLNARRAENNLTISPAFQRRAVWLNKERSALLATICSDLPFPEIYIQIITDNVTGRQEHVVVDGQQRITSILMFIDGSVSLPDDAMWVGKGFKDLSLEQRQGFWDYKIVVRELKNTTELEIRDLFTRLNTNNISLNDQELRNARYVGKFKQCCERLADNPSFLAINLFTAREVRRMEDIEYVGELLVRAVEGITNKKDLLEESYAHYDEEFPEEALFEHEFNSSIQLLMSISTPENATAFKTKSNFYSLFGVCLKYFRGTQRSFFTKPVEISAEISALLLAARSFNPVEPSPDPMVQHYYDAVSRAASDRSRRFHREEILWSIVGKHEGLQIVEDLLDQRALPLQS